LDNDIAVLDTACLEFGNGAGNEGIYNWLIPPCMDDGDAKGCSVEGFGGLRETFDRAHPSYRGSIFISLFAMDALLPSKYVPSLPHAFVHPNQQHIPLYIPF